jgi:Protein of unknown function (DUF2914)
MRNMYLWVKKHISALAFATGFLIDSLTLTRIDLLYENFVFVSYLLIACVGIFLVHAVDTRVFAPTLLLKTRSWLPILVQFPLGGLFSGFVIFYSKSGSLITSWPFMLILLGLFVGNEFFKKRYEKMVFQVGLFYFALYSYLVLIMPVLLKNISTVTFVFAGLVSFMCITIMLIFIKKLFPKMYQQGRRRLWFVVIGIFVGYNTLYATNSIPPVPLAVKEIGVYHSVVRSGSDSYAVTFEKPVWYESWRDTSKIFHRKNGTEAVYCFSSVFAPTNLQAPIYHSWQRKNKNGAWVRESRIHYTIEGGRSSGYRGYTLKQNLEEGTWRCVVETENQLVIGYTQFNVKNVIADITLEQGTR